jgi:hypothetical protein
MAPAFSFGLLVLLVVPLAACGDDGGVDENEANGVIALAAVPGREEDSCAILSGGRVECSVAGGDHFLVAATAYGPPLDGVTQLEVAFGGGCGVRAGAVSCWGIWPPADDGQGPSAGTSLVDRGAVEVRGAGNFVCVGMESGVVECWYFGGVHVGHFIVAGAKLRDPQALAILANEMMDGGPDRYAAWSNFASCLWQEICVMNESLTLRL